MIIISSSFVSQDNIFLSPGLLGGLVGLCCVELYYTPPSAWLTLGVLLSTGLVFALLTLYFQALMDFKMRDWVLFMKFI